MQAEGHSFYYLLEKLSIQDQNTIRTNYQKNIGKLRPETKVPLNPPDLHKIASYFEHLYGKTHQEQYFCYNLKEIQ